VKKNNENGYSVVVVPIILGILLLLIAFIFEYGRYVTIKHQLQSTADSAVLAGVSMCRVEYVDIKDIVEEGIVNTEGNTKVVLLEDKAINEAKKYLNKNLETLKIKNVDVKEETVNIYAEDNVLKIELKAEIKGIFVTALFNKDNLLTITIKANAEPIDV